MSRTLDKLIRQTRQEKITFQHRLNLHQLLLRQIEIKIHIQGIHKLGNWVRVLIRLLLYNLDELAHLFVVIVRVSFAEMGGYDCGCEVAENPGGGSLDGVYVGGGEEEFAERFTAVFGVEEGEEGPVD